MVKHFNNDKNDETMCNKPILLDYLLNSIQSIYGVTSPRLHMLFNSQPNSLISGKLDLAPWFCSFKNAVPDIVAGSLFREIGFPKTKTNEKFIPRFHKSIFALHFALRVAF